SPEEIREAKRSGLVVAAKLYPAGATTNSDSGVTDIELIRPVLQAMSEAGMPLLVHGEVTHDDVDVFDREERFVEEVLKPLIQSMPELKVVMEHITTRAAAAFVSSAPSTVAATVTPQHLLHNRGAIFRGGLRPHMYCLPILKREEDRKALVAAATSGSTKFFLGSDSAPHAEGAKLSACGCAGIFSGHAALELYAEVFEAAGALQHFAAFCSTNGADFYGLPRNAAGAAPTTTLRRAPWTVPATYLFGAARVVRTRA
ncbi:unnamed protein product, partial [Phaeothamnion confervicola]